MKIFLLKNYDLQLADEVFAIPAFTNILDKYDDKDLGIAELRYIFFVQDFRSDFSDILDVEERKKKVLETVIGDVASQLKLDELTDKAMKFYNERQMTLSLHLLVDARNAISKVQDYLRTVDLTLTDNNGKPVHDIKKLTDTLGAMPKLIAALNELEQQVKRELDESERIRGGQEKGFFEDA